MLKFDLFTSYLEKKSSRGGGGATKSKKKRKEALIRTERLIHFTFAWKEMRGIDPDRQTLRSSLSTMYG
jgi:hypothetical protein